MAQEPNFRGASQLPGEQADMRRQREVARTVSSAVPSWVKDGRMVQGTLTDGNEGSVTHGLNRVPKGWVLCNPSGSADRVSLIQTGSDSSVVRLKNLGATGGLSFSLWVF